MTIWEFMDKHPMLTFFLVVELGLALQATVLILRRRR